MGRTRPRQGRKARHPRPERVEAKVKPGWHGRPGDTARSVRPVTPKYLRSQGRHTR